LLLLGFTQSSELGFVRFFFAAHPFCGFMTTVLFG